MSKTTIGLCAAVHGRRRADRDAAHRARSSTARSSASRHPRRHARLLPAAAAPAAGAQPGRARRDPVRLRRGQRRDGRLDERARRRRRARPRQADHVLAARGLERRRLRRRPASPRSRRALGVDPRVWALFVGVALWLTALFDHGAARQRVHALEEGASFALPSRGVLLIGALCFLAMVTEGAIGDWSGIYLRQNLGASAAAAATAFTGFSLGMAVARLGGDWLNERLGAGRAAARRDGARRARARRRAADRRSRSRPSSASCSRARDRQRRPAPVQRRRAPRPARPVAGRRVHRRLHRLHRRPAADRRAGRSRSGCRRRSRCCASSRVARDRARRPRARYSSASSISSRISPAASWMRVGELAPVLVGDRAVGGQHLGEAGDDRQRRAQVVAQPAAASSASRIRSSSLTSAGGRGDEALAQGDRDRVHARVGLELGHRVADVGLDRLGREEQPLRHLLAGQALGEQVHDLALALGQRLLRLGRPAREQRGVQARVDVRAALGDRRAAPCVSSLGVPSLSA